MIRARATAFFDDDDNDRAPDPTWIMGIPYTELREEERRLDVFSTMWITYRSGFPRMEPYGYTDDSGWGCMLRSAQMLMTQALQRHTLGRSWRVPRALEERLRVPEYRTLVRLFADNPGEDNLFSIHNMCQVGIRYDKLPGEWYGPTTAACVLRDISELYAARLSPSATTRQGSDGAPCVAPAPEPPPLPPPTPPQQQQQPQKAGNLEHTAAAAPLESSATAGEDGHPDEGGTREGQTQGVLGEMAVPRREGRKGAVRGSGGRDGGLLGRFASSNENGGGTDGGGGGCVVDGGKNCRRRAGKKDEDGEDGGVFRSSRPLRVFVSQGDVVYADEVEAVAIRGGDEEDAPLPSPPASTTADNGHASGQTNSGRTNRAAATGRADGHAAPPDARADTAVKSEGGASPAFFDPLLNPGSGGEQSKRAKAWSSAVLLLVPLRLGLDELSESYIPTLLETLRVPQSLGFLGGRPNHAIFFIGAQGKTLTGLDPHTTQAAPVMGEGFPSERYVHSLHCQTAVSMDVHRIDPSLALAFYLPDRAAFEDLIKKIEKTNPPPFSVEQTRPDYEGEMGLAFMINQREDEGTTDDEDDEYVFVKGPER